MPHVIVKLQGGRSEQQKAKIAAEVTKAIMATANCAEDAVSTASRTLPLTTGPRSFSSRTSSGIQAGSTKNPDTIPDSNEKSGATRRQRRTQSKRS